MLENDVNSIRISFCKLPCLVKTHPEPHGNYDIHCQMLVLLGNIRCIFTVFGNRSNRRNILPVLCTPFGVANDRTTEMLGLSSFGPLAMPQLPVSVGGYVQQKSRECTSPEMIPFGRRRLVALLRNQMLILQFNTMLRDLMGQAP